MVLGRVQKNGTIVIEEGEELAEGTLVEITALDDEDDLDDKERAALHRAIDISAEQIRRGEVEPAEKVIADLRRRR